MNLLYGKSVRIVSSENKIDKIVNLQTRVLISKITST